MKFTYLLSVLAVAKASQEMETAMAEVALIDLNAYSPTDPDWIIYATNTFDDITKLAQAIGLGAKSWTNSAPNEPKNLWFAVMKLLELIKDVGQKNTDMNVTFNTSITNSMETIINNTKVYMNDLTEQGKYNLGSIVDLQLGTNGKLDKQQALLQETVTTSLDTVEVKLDYLIKVAEMMQTAFGEYIQLLTFEQFKAQKTAPAPAPASGTA